MIFLELIPRWAFAAAVLALSLLCGYLKFSNVSLHQEISQHEKHIAQLDASIALGKAEQASQSARFAEQARATEQARAAREKTILADSASARRELDRLRGILSRDSSPVTVQNPESPTINPRDTVEDLLTVSSRYVELAEKCDRHASDVKALTDAWPK